MTTAHSTHQPITHLPRQPLYLPPDALEACNDIVKNNIDGASLESLQTLRGVADYLLGGVVHFVNTHPDTQYAGLILDVQVLLPIVEPLDPWDFLDDEEGDEL